MWSRVIVCALCAFLGQTSAFAVGGAAVQAHSRSSVCMAARLRTNDMVKVISGNDKGKVAKLLSIDKKKGLVLVEGVNVRTKHVKPMKEGESGSILKKERPIHISNVALSDEQPAVEAAAE